MKAKRIIPMILIIILILAALFVIFTLVMEMNSEKHSSGVTENIVIENPSTVTSPETDTVSTIETTVDIPEENESITLEPTEAENNTPEVTETPMPPVVIENQGEIEIIIPEGQESAGE